ncbi:MAG: valine--tRNA ligase [Alphaproteobacteria bacterium]
MLDKTYHSSEVEDRIYQKWEESGVFACNPTSDKEPYTILMPPPNVTGSLHIGHALTFTIQDLLARFWRMRGKDVLWQPGKDHAGIATQMVVERQLDAEGISRHDLGREKFLERVWQWKEQSGDTIFNQLRRLGASADWKRERFTMDDGLSAAVRKIFVQLYKEELIYKDKRLVNWDKKLGTAISDLEVEQKEINGKMWYFRYPVEGEDEYVVVATTRPETMLGDTAVAVHPNDERYAHLHGKNVILPIVGRKIPIVLDDYADPEKGTGVVKITPAHDFNDFEVGRRNDLELINIFDASIHLNENVPERFRGLSAEDARIEVVQTMEELGLLERIEDHKLQQPHGDRSGVVIEPWLMDQWFVDAPKLAKEALKAVEDDITQFVPKQWENTYFEWMRNIQPWCVSRQLWWGHQIPVWYGSDGTIFCEETFEDAKKAAQKHYGKEVELTQDEDVLDTWFSSGLWPFSTLGWPEETKELKKYYPTNVLVTGFDIIFFWVARMMMMSLHVMDDVPFKDVYIHALVRDAKGQKMSKSKGNVVDPLEVMGKYGTDSLRLTLTALAAQGRDVRMSDNVVEGYRNFITKLWNVSRFIQMNGCQWDTNFNPRKVEFSINKWIIARTQKAAKRIQDGIESYRFNDAASGGYQFTWDEFASWYIEFAKPLFDSDNEKAKIETQKTAAWVLEKILRMMHPIIPFVTEELYNLLYPEQGMLMAQSFPLEEDFPVTENDEAELRIERFIRIISKIRTLRSEMSIKPSAKLELLVRGADEKVQETLQLQLSLMERMAKISTITFSDEEWPKGTVQDIVDELTIGLPLANVIDVSKEVSRLEKEISKLDKEIALFKGKLSNPNFVDRAPENVVEEQRTKLRDALSGKDRLTLALERFLAL